MTQTLFIAEPIWQAADTEASHEVCCIDEQAETCRVSMCGLPIPDGPLGVGAPSCVVCLDLLDLWARYADTYGEDPCEPGDMPCRLCPRRQHHEDRNGHVGR